MIGYTQAQALDMTRIIGPSLRLRVPRPGAGLSESPSVASGPPGRRAAAGPVTRGRVLSVAAAAGRATPAVGALTRKDLDKREIVVLFGLIRVIRAKK